MCWDHKMEHGVADIQLLVHKEHSQLMGKKYKTFFLINPSSQWSCWKYFTLCIYFIHCSSLQKIQIQCVSIILRFRRLFCAAHSVISDRFLSQKWLLLRRSLKIQINKNWEYLHLVNTEEYVTWFIHWKHLHFTRNI